MRKKIQSLLSAVLTLCVVFSLLCPAALAADAGTAGNQWDVSAEPGTDSVTAVFDSSTGTLTISGAGRMTSYHYTATNIPWADVKQEIKSVVVEEGVMNVGAYAFNYCRNLTSVSLPESLTEIGTYAFHATGVKRLTIPAGVDTIGRMIATPNTYFEVLGRRSSAIPPMRSRRAIPRRNWPGRRRTPRSSSPTSSARRWRCSSTAPTGS